MATLSVPQHPCLYHIPDSSSPQQERTDWDFPSWIWTQWASSVLRKRGESPPWWCAHRPKPSHKIRVCWEGSRRQGHTLTVFLDYTDGIDSAEILNIYISVTFGEPSLSAFDTMTWHASLLNEMDSLSLFFRLQNIFQCKTFKYLLKTRKSYT